MRENRSRRTKGQAGMMSFMVLSQMKTSNLVVGVCGCLLHVYSVVVKAREVVVRAQVAAALLRKWKQARTREDSQQTFNTRSPAQFVTLWE